MSSSRIISVWDVNMEKELLILSKLTETYNVIAINTRSERIHNVSDIHNYPDQLTVIADMCRHLNSMTITQIAISISDEHGNKPKDNDTWEFNFKYDITSANEGSTETRIHMLSQNAFDVERHAANGINHNFFRMIFTVLQFVMNKHLKWITYHGNNDIAHMIQLVTGYDIPVSNEHFYKLLHAIFPNFLDLRHITVCPRFKNRFIPQHDLQHLANHLGCKRLGYIPNAGSDATLCIDIYHKLKHSLYDGDMRSMNGVLHDLPLCDAVRPILN